MRGRDLTISIVTDLADFATDKAVRGLEDLGDAADTSSRKLDKIDGRNVSKSLDNLGDDAKTAARKVDDAFDGMADSARQSASRMDSSADRAKRSMRDMRDEAGATSREMAASFGSTGDIADAFQEMAANVPAVLGPLGTAIGTAAGVGVGMIIAESERLREEVNSMVDDMIESGGRLSAEFVNNKVRDMAKEGDLQRIKDMTNELNIQGVSWQMVARAKAGDESAMKGVIAALDQHSAANQRMLDQAGNVDAATGRQRENNQLLRNELEGTRQAMQLAADATSIYGAASSTASGEVLSFRTEVNEARAAAGKPIIAKVSVEGPPPGALAAIRQNMTAALGTIVVPVAAGTSPTKNTADNSRYRW